MSTTEDSTSFTSFCQRCRRAIVLDPPFDPTEEETDNTRPFNLQNLPDKDFLGGSTAAPHSDTAENEKNRMQIKRTALAVALQSTSIIRPAKFVLNTLSLCAKMVYTILRYLVIAILLTGCIFCDYTSWRYRDLADKFRQMLLLVSLELPAPDWGWVWGN
ncbi:hypothetical protein BDQ17DRAFT_1326476 [Cyathus striatus]|nr:hypothetical protein BDQ17DRAFT_1326476 [Cyathus striatus]